MHSAFGLACCSDAHLQESSHALIKRPGSMALLSQILEALPDARVSLPQSLHRPWQLVFHGSSSFIGLIHLSPLIFRILHPAPAISYAHEKRVFTRWAWTITVPRMVQPPTSIHLECVSEIPCGMLTIMGSFTAWLGWRRKVPRIFIVKIVSAVSSIRAETGKTDHAQFA